MLGTKVRKGRENPKSSPRKLWLKPLAKYSQPLVIRFKPLAKYPQPLAKEKLTAKGISCRAVRLK